jgi:hypothetical protein
VIRGDISSHDLVNLSAADLASKEQQARREVITDELAQSRRSDWLETHKKDIQLDIGLDPGNEWECDDPDEVESQPVSAGGCALVVCVLVCFVVCCDVL